MSRNPVYLGLMLLAFLSAFVLPPRVTDPPRSELAGLLAPVARPARALAGRLYRRLHPITPIDLGSPSQPRPNETILQENQRLREQLTNLTLRYDQLAQLNNARDLRADILPFCKPVAVEGVDTSGGREALMIGSSSLAGLAPEDPVLYAPQCLAGRIVRSGISGAQVRLITDPGFTETARIMQIVQSGDGNPQSVLIDTLQPLIEGLGKGRMIIRSTISLQQAIQLKISPGDLLVLDDPTWPANVRGATIGRITAVTPQPNAPLFAQIMVVPMADLTQLREVMVMVGQK